MSTQLRDYKGNIIVPDLGRLDNANTIYVGCVMDAFNTEYRFTAMNELYDIAQKIDNGDMSDHSAEFTKADCGIVCKLPIFNTEMFVGYDFDILFSKNADYQTHPASTTKVMSLITGLDWISNIHDMVTIVSSDIVSGSGSTYYAGDNMLLESLIFAIMVESSNTCANAFARICGRKMLNNDTATDDECRAEFIRQMNIKAVELGMINSVFDTPHGMTKTNISTAHDMLLATIEACRFPWILRAWQFVPTRTIHIYGDNDRDIVLARTVAPESLTDNYHVFGGKTGSLLYDEFSANALVMIVGAK